MPRLIVDRFIDDTIRQFRAAAAMRNEDAWRLFDAGRGAAAIYLWGYVAEMTLKAAWFRMIGFTKDRPIQIADLRRAVALAETAYAIPWPAQGRFHAIGHWAELLTQHRMVRMGDYADPTFGVTVVRHSQRIYQRWRETMRYKSNRPYPAETRVVAESANWLLGNCLNL